MSITRPKLPHRTLVASILAAAAGLVAGVGSMALPAAAQTFKPGPRVALVIANGGLPEPHRLPTAKTDADALAERLRQRDFALVASGSDGSCTTGAVQSDLGRDAMLKALACLASGAAGADQALLYVAGHAVDADGKLFLVPADASLAAKPEATALVDVAAELQKLDAAGPKLQIVVVDGLRRSSSQAEPKPGLLKATLPATSKPRIAALALLTPAAATPAAPGSAPPTSAPQPTPPPTGEGTITPPPAAPKASTDTPQSPAATPAPAVPEPPKAAAPAPPAPSLSSALISALDGDIDDRSLGGPGREPSALLQPTDAAGKPDAAIPVEIVVDGAPGTVVVGRFPDIGTKPCDVLVWRAKTLEICVEMAAAYDACGDNADLKRALTTDCKADWDTLMRNRLRSSLPEAVKTKTCKSLKDLAGRFEAEPAMKEVSEYKELVSLSNYTCALEAQENLKKEFAATIAARQCDRIKSFKSANATIDAEMTKQLDDLAKAVCCPTVGLKGECLSTAAATAKVLKLLEEKGCDLGRDKKGRARRAEYLMNQVGARFSQPIKLDSTPLQLDDGFAALERMTKDECSCVKREVVAATGACKSGPKQ